METLPDASRLGDLDRGGNVPHALGVRMEIIGATGRHSGMVALHVTEALRERANWRNAVGFSYARGARPVSVDQYKIASLGQRPSDRTAAQPRDDAIIPIMLRDRK